MTRYRWVILAVGVLAQAAYSAVVFALPVLAPDLRDEYGLSLGEIGALFAAVSAGTTITLLPWGLLTDRVGERSTVTVGMAGLGAGFLAAAALPPYWLLLALVTLAGACGAGVSAASGRAVLGWFARSQRGLALGVRQASVPLGGALASLAVPALLDLSGLAWSLAALGILCFVSGVAGLVWLREPAREEEHVEELGRPLRDGRLWRLSVGSTFYVMVQIAITSFLVLYLHEERGVSLAAAGAAAASVHVVGFVGRIVLGHVSDRIGSRIALLRALGLSMTAATAAAALLLSVPLELVVPLLVLAGGLSMCWNGLSFTAVAELAGRRRSGAALGVQQTMLSLGCAVMPVVFAFVVDAASWRAAFALLAVLPLVGWRVLGPLS